MRQYLWHFYFGEYERASLRWVLALFAMLALFPGVGSGGSVMAIVMWLIAVPYWIFDPETREMTRGEMAVVSVFATYFLVAVGFALFHAAVGDGAWTLGNVWNNLPFLLAAPAFTVLRRAARPYWTPIVFAGVACGALLAAVIVTLGGQFSAHVLRAGFSGNELILGLGVLVSGLLCVHAALSTTGWMRLLMTAGALAGLYVLVLSGGRGPLLAYCAALVCYALIMGFRYYGVRWMMVRLTIWAVLIAVVGTVTIRFDPELAERYSLVVERLNSPDDAAIDEESIRIRMVLYESGLRAFLDRPLTGYGRQNAVAAVAARNDGAPEHFFHFSHLHSGYLTDLISSGICGLLSLLAVLLVPAVVFWRAQPVVFGGVLCVVLAYAFYGVTNLLFYHDVVTFLFLGLTCSFNALNQIDHAADGHAIRT